MCTDLSHRMLPLVLTVQPAGMPTCATVSGHLHTLYHALLGTGFPQFQRLSFSMILHLHQHAHTHLQYVCVGFFHGVFPWCVGSLLGCCVSPMVASSLQVTSLLIHCTDNQRQSVFSFHFRFVLQAIRVHEV